MKVSRWWESLTGNEGQLVLLVAALAAILAVGYYLISKVRGSGEDSNPSVSDVLASFRDLQEQGELSDDEFRSIKTQLSSKLQQELKRPPAKETPP